MWASLARWFASALLIPLIKEAGAALYKWALSVIARKKKETENQEKSDAYVNSADTNASGDNFANLP